MVDFPLVPSELSPTLEESTEIQEFQQAAERCTNAAPANFILPCIGIFLLKIGNM
jgi:hypothetical protein